MTTETNKDRLLAIKLALTFRINKDGHKRLGAREWPFIDIHREDAKWLIKQAERAHELEEAMKGAHVVLNIETNDRKRFQEENDRLRKVLEGIAGYKVFDGRRWYEYQQDLVTLVSSARQALAGVPDD